VNKAELIDKKKKKKSRGRVNYLGLEAPLAVGSPWGISPSNWTWKSSLFHRNASNRSQRLLSSAPFRVAQDISPLTLKVGKHLHQCLIVSRSIVSMEGWKLSHLSFGITQEGFFARSVEKSCPHHIVGYMTGGASHLFRGCLGSLMMSNLRKVLELPTTNG
jgi:hypothetical protein